MVEVIDTERKLPTRVVGQIISKTDGVPLFIEEVTKTVLTVGSKKGEVARGVPWTAEVPETLHDLSDGKA